MGTQGAAGVIDRQEWLRPIEDILRQAIHTAFLSAGPTGQRIKNVLHGSWLGHPLHAALASIPIGAWTTAMLFDIADAVSDRREFRVADEAALKLGVAGALGAAAAGLTDWQDTDPPARRIGLKHGLMNIGSVALFAGSLVARKRRSRAGGRSLSALGCALAMAAARLGGQMVYGQRVGVDHTAGQAFPDDFVPVLAESRLLDGMLRRVPFNGFPILLARRGNRIFALAGTCSHMGGPLSEGQLVDSSVKCPWQRFALCSGGRARVGRACRPPSTLSPGPCPKSADRGAEGVWPAGGVTAA